MCCWQEDPEAAVHNTRSNGYRLARRVQNKCRHNGYGYEADIFDMVHLYKTNNFAIQYCPVWKAGSTFWKRAFMIKNLPEYKNVTNLYNLSFLANYDAEQGHMDNSGNFKRFMFVREPFQRLLSTFVDKVLAPNPFYWKIIGVPAINTSRSDPSEKSLECGHDLTFAEFLKHLSLVMSPGKHTINVGNKRTVSVFRDIHFEIFNILCRPCNVKYDFIGKMETFQDDASEVLKLMNLTHLENSLETEAENLAAVDAIKDTVYQPFNKEMRADIVHCMTIKEALSRVWDKLQIRGLIGDRDLKLSEHAANNITYEQFLVLALHARKMSTRENRQMVKRTWYQKMYSTIDRSILDKLREIYKDDFELFEYDSKPSQLFS